MPSPGGGGPPCAKALVTVKKALEKNPDSLEAGYKVDAFFNAMDGGFEKAHEINVIDQGPYLGFVVKLP